MPIITATQVTVYSDISASAATILASGKIAVVQDRITYICNNYFTSDLYLNGPFTFNATARTVVTSGNEWASYGFAAADDIYIYHSYRNDGYYTVSSISGSTLTLITGSSVQDELSGRSIMISVVQWPSDLLATAAQMVAFDYDIRPTRSSGTLSIRLGPWSESYGKVANGEFGYPLDLIAPLNDHKIVRLM